VQFAEQFPEKPHSDQLPAQLPAQLPELPELRPELPELRPELLLEQLDLALLLKFDQLSELSDLLDLP
jgi:hypothetical protein